MLRIRCRIARFNFNLHFCTSSAAPPGTCGPSHASHSRLSKRRQNYECAVSRPKGGFAGIRALCKHEIMYLFVRATCFRENIFRGYWTRNSAQPPTSIWPSPCVFTRICTQHHTLTPESSSAVSAFLLFRCPSLCFSVFMPSATCCRIILAMSSLPTLSMPRTSSDVA